MQKINDRKVIETVYYGMFMMVQAFILVAMVYYLMQIDRYLADFASFLYIMIRVPIDVIVLIKILEPSNY